MAANGISTLETKLARQTAKLDIAQAKRQGKIVALDGTISGDIDTTKPYYRTNNTYSLTLLPDTYATAGDDNPNYPVGGKINAITIATPLTRSDGGNYLTPANVSIQFALPSAGGGIGSNRATGTPVITNGKLSGITIVSGGSGYAKRITEGILNGQVLCDIFVVDNTSGSLDSRELRDITTTGFDVSASDITNTVGLLQGRPWYDPNTEVFYDGEVLEVSPGIWRTNYQNYYFEDGNFFDTAALKTGGAAYNGPTSDISIPNLPEYTSIMLIGYMKVTYTGTYTFYLDCDDGAYMWFGDDAIDNWKDTEGTLINYDINNGGEHGQQEVAGTVNLTAGNYIPIRVAFGNNGGPGILIVSYSHPGQAKTSDFTGKIFYRTSTNGF